MLLSLVAAAAIGWIAFQLQQQKLLPQFLFPLLFPLLIGSAVGAVCARLLGGVSAGTIMPMLAAACGGLLAVAVEVFCGYQYYVATIERQLQSNPIAMLAHSANEEFSHASLTQFVAVRIRDSGGWWYADAVLTIIASVAVCWLLRTTPAPPGSPLVSTDKTNA